MYSNILSLAIVGIKNSMGNINKMEGNQEVISRLKFIGKLKKGEKFNTKHMYIQPNGIGTSISRTFIYQDNRGNALSFCQETIFRAFELLITYERSYIDSEKLLFRNLLKDLQQSMTGLKNLKSTYNTDTKFCCDMDTLLENTNSRLNYFLVKYTDDDLLDTLSNSPSSKNNLKND